MLLYQTLRVARRTKQRTGLLPPLPSLSLLLLFFPSPTPPSLHQKGLTCCRTPGSRDPGKAEEGSPSPPRTGAPRALLPPPPRGEGSPVSPRPVPRASSGLRPPLCPHLAPRRPRAGTAPRGWGPPRGGARGCSAGCGRRGGAAACGTQAPPTRIKVLRCLVSPSIKLILSEV